MNVSHFLYTEVERLWLKPMHHCPATLVLSLASFPLPFLSPPIFSLLSFPVVSLNLLPVHNPRFLLRLTFRNPFTTPFYQPLPPSPVFFSPFCFLFFFFQSFLYPLSLSTIFCRTENLHWWLLPCKLINTFFRMRKFVTGLADFWLLNAWFLDLLTGAIM